MESLERVNKLAAFILIAYKAVIEFIQSMSRAVYILIPNTIKEAHEFYSTEDRKERKEKERIALKVNYILL